MSRFARGPGNILIVKTDRALAGPSQRADGLRDRRRPTTPTAASPASAAWSACSPRPPTTPRCTTCRCCAAASTAILRRSGLDVHSHDGKALLAILEAYPRDELFQIDEDTLYDHVLGILQLQERRRVALFARRDAVGRFATCLVFAPRERFDAALSDQFAAILEQAWQGKVPVGRRLGQQRFGAGPGALHAEARFQRHADARSRRARARARRRRDLVERPLRAPPCRRAGRGRGPRRRPPLARLVPRRLSRQLRCRPGRGRPRAGAGRPGRPAVRRAARPRARPAGASLHAAAVPSQGAARAVRHPAAGREPRPARAERGAVPAASAGDEAWRCRC